jgi:hypothetical protein
MSTIFAITLMADVVRTSEVSLSFIETTRRSIPKDGHLYIRRHKNLKSYVIIYGLKFVEQCQ